MSGVENFFITYEKVEDIYFFAILKMFHRWSKTIRCNMDEDKGKSFSEALILASTNPQYDKRLFMELP